MNKINKDLLKKYDSQIRNKCDYIKHKLELCLLNNFNDEFSCKDLMMDFKNCTEEFTKDFKKKYKII